MRPLALFALALMGCALDVPGSDAAGFGECGWALAGAHTPIASGHCAIAIAPADHLVSTSGDACVAEGEAETCRIFTEGEQPLVYRRSFAVAADVGFREVELTADGLCPLSCR